MLRGLIKKSARVGATLGLATVAAIAAIAPAAAQSSRELVITIERIRALDVIDWGLAGDADFFARVTIDGQVYTTQRVRGKDYVQPNWRIAKDVGRGKYDVKLEIFDKDPLKPDDVIDINRIGFKRDLDFVVDTRNCRVEGFANRYKCEQLIERAGGERKRAEISFRVSVERY